MGENKDLDVPSILKKNWVWIILVLILVFGFYLRAYHMDYPVIGYHNWKETHYLTEARNFARDGFFYEGIFMPHYDYPSSPDVNPSGIHSDSFPTISILIGIMFNIFGDSLFVARLVNILLSIGATFFGFLFMKKLFDREDIAIIFAALMAINPLFVFFGRQTQLVNASIFLMMLGLFFYLLWIEKPSYRNLIIFTISITLAVATKYSFLLIGVPMAFIFPYKRLKEYKTYYKQILIFVAIFMFIPIWFMYSNSATASHNGDSVNEQVGLIDYMLPLKSEFWQQIKPMNIDNYTEYGIPLFLIGIVVFFLTFKKKREYAFLLSYLGGSMIWFCVMAFKISGHSYHQYPIVPMILMFIAYLITIVSVNIEKIIKVKNIKYGIIALVCILLFFPSAVAYNRQFDTQFVGLDIAGEYIKSHSDPDEKVFHPSHQSYGVLWHADRKGYKIPKDIETFKKTEDQGTDWLFVYQWGMSIMSNPEVWDYVKENYELKQIAFQKTQKGNQPIYFLFKKGGTFNESMLNSLGNQTVKTKNYEYTRSISVPVYYINLEE